MIGQQATVITPTRGKDGAGEVVIEQGGGTEIYLAWSDLPLSKGTPVVIYGIRGARTVDVEPLNSGS